MRCSLKEKLPPLSFRTVFHPRFIFLQRKLTCAPLDALSVQPVCVRKEECACCESGWSSDEHLLSTPPSSSLSPSPSPSLLSLLQAVIDLIPSFLNWSHDSCCSDWPSLTTHRHSSVMLSAIYLSICLCLLCLSSGRRRINLLTIEGWQGRVSSLLHTAQMTAFA